MGQNTIGFSEEPRNGHGIVRSRTTLQLRAWDIPRSQAALEAFNTEIGKMDFPAVYMLFTDAKVVYVGEAKSVYNRLKTHVTAPQDKIKDWKKALVVNDGRPAAQSDFNDTVVRRALGIYLKGLLRANKYNVVSEAEPQTLNPHQKQLVDSLTAELNFFLLRKNIVSKMLEEKEEREVFPDELRDILLQSGKTITKWGVRWTRMVSNWPSLRRDIVATV